MVRLGDRHAIVFVQPARAQEGRAPSIDAEKAAAYDGLAAGAWEFTCEGSGGKLRWTGKVLYSANPADVGTSPTIDMEMTGDNARWWFIDAEGKRGGDMEAARIVR